MDSWETRMRQVIKYYSTRMAKMTVCTLIAISFVFLLGCGKSSDTEKGEVEKKGEEQSTEAQVPTREDFEKRLSALNLPVYEGAEFDAVKKNKHGEGYSIFYSIPDKSNQAVEKVHLFYDKLLNALAREKGWKRIDAGNLIMLQDGAEVPVSVSNAINIQSKKHLLQFQMKF